MKKLLRWLLPSVLALVATGLGITALCLRSEVARLRAKADAFDDYCAAVWSAVDLMRLDLQLTPPPRWLDERINSYYVLRTVGDRNPNDLRACATTPIDFKALEERRYACTLGEHACLAEEMKAIKQHLRHPRDR